MVGAKYAALGVLLVLCSCRYAGAQSMYGRSKDSMNFGEVDVVLMDREGGRTLMVPFVVVGEGTLPAEYGDNESFQRVSAGNKARLPIVLRDGRVVLYVEAGGMVSYYEGGSIGTPFELEVVGGVGAQVDLGKGWWVDVGARARHPTGNGNDHKEPEHAPHGTAPEFILGVKKDF
jgi:hypothetical protein